MHGVGIQAVLKIRHAQTPRFEAEKTWSIRTLV